MEEKSQILSGKLLKSHRQCLDQNESKVKGAFQGYQIQKGVPEFVTGDFVERKSQIQVRKLFLPYEVLPGPRAPLICPVKPSVNY